MKNTIISLMLTAFCFSGLSQEDPSILYRASEGNLRGVKASILRGEDINARGYDGRTPLHGAVANSEIEVVKWLVENGADINLKASTGSSLETATSAETESVEGLPIWPWLLALAMIIGQIWYATSGEAVQWPNMFRWLGTLSFAAFALMIALMISNKKATNELAGWEIFEILLTPFVGFISCYLTAHVLETFDKIKENTDRLREAD